MKLILNFRMGNQQFQKLNKNNKPRELNIEKIQLKIRIGINLFDLYIAQFKHKFSITFLASL